MQKVVFLGISGEAVYYSALYFYYLGCEIEGYDLNKNERSEKLTELGAKIYYKNSTDKFEKETSQVIYSSGIPKNIINSVRGNNKGIPFVEVGEFHNKLIDRYEQKRLNSKEKEAFLKSDIAPLFKLDTKNTKLIGITGTDGKTTTSELIYNILINANKNAALVSTINAKINGKVLDTGLHTSTPSPHTTYKLIKDALDKKCEYIILECTSQGLYMGRLRGIKFDIAGITNITQDHLEYHKTYENYVNAKALLITKHLKKTGISIINKDDQKPLKMLRKVAKDIYYYSFNTLSKDETGLRCSILKTSDDKTEVGIKTEKETVSCCMPFFEKYNVANACLAYSVCINLGILPEMIIKGIENNKKPWGRTEFLQKTPVTVIVDFAHTPNALKNILIAVKKLKKDKENKIILVFGCASQRDDNKRAKMGLIAAKYADITILTAEDCRYEPLVKINNEIESGYNKVKIKGELYRFDKDNLNTDIRKNAIQKALDISKNGDIVLITGKGHENSLCFNGIEYPWNDIVETNKLLKKHEWNT